MHCNIIIDMQCVHVVLAMAATTTKDKNNAKNKKDSEVLSDDNKISDILVTFLFNQKRLDNIDVHSKAKKRSDYR